MSKLTQFQKVELDEGTEVVLMKLGENFLYKHKKDITNYFNLLAEKVEWIDDPESFDLVSNLIKDTLLYAVRDPTNYKRKLLVDSNADPKDYQEFYDDFNPVINLQKLADQGLVSPPKEGERPFTLQPKFILFHVLLNLSGWLTPVASSPVEEVEDFHDDGTINPETNDNGVLQRVPPQTE